MSELNYKLDFRQRTLTHYYLYDGRPLDNTMSPKRQM